MWRGRGAMPRIGGRTVRLWPIFLRFSPPHFPEARWAWGPQEQRAWVEFDCASMAQNAFCINRLDLFASERRAERRNVAVPPHEPLRYIEISLRR